MNVFVTSPCPIESAHALDKKRLNKMILESAQMLSTALHIHNLGLGIGSVDTKALRGNSVRLEGLYKPTHPNHPSNIWVRETRENFYWTLKHMEAMVELRQAVEGKSHKSAELIPLFHKYAYLIPEGQLTPFANCAANQSVGVDFKHLEVIEAYRKYLSQRWKLDKREPVWYPNCEPKWRE